MIVTWGHVSVKSIVCICDISAPAHLFPAWVAQVLALHPHVREAAVRSTRQDEGQRPEAFAVAQPGTDVDALRTAWTFGARLPRQASGKGADWIIDAQ